ncbi:MAG TPA: methyltransferase domain-containing protein [Candidatus Omnitrophota bacterium]|nr:methyltransferase domain-containing protein [Candidatus Omnitrophota bacterium]
MLLDFIDQKIRKAFSDAAFEYDLLTSLHKEIGRELIKKVIAHEPAEAVLDIGMGTGWLTSRIKFYLPESKIVGIDFADGMVKIAKDQWADLDIIQANALKLPFKDRQFDLVTSNLSLQWAKDLSATFSECQRCLKEGGSIYGTVFGYETFRELFTALEHAHKLKKGSDDLNIQRLKSVKEIEAALGSSGFKDIQLDHEIIKVHFGDMFRLVKWIKDIGANALAKQAFIGKDLLDLANEYYEKNYKDKFGVSTTFEVIWVQATK